MLNRQSFASSRRRTSAAPVSHPAVAVAQSSSARLAEAILTATTAVNATELEILRDVAKAALRNREHGSTRTMIDLHDALERLEAHKTWRP